MSIFIKVNDPSPSNFKPDIEWLKSGRHASSDAPINGQDIKEKRSRRLDNSGFICVNIVNINDES